MGFLPLGDIPGHNLAVPVIDHQIGPKPDATNAGREVGDVPAPDLIRSVSPQGRYGTRHLRKARPPAALGLTMGRPPVRKERHNLPGWQGCEFRLVAGEQNPLALLLREAVRHQAVTAFTAIGAVPITCELMSPARKFRQPHAQEFGKLPSPSTGCHPGIEDLKGPCADPRGRVNPPRPIHSRPGS